MCIGQISQPCIENSNVSRWVNDDDGDDDDDKDLVHCFHILEWDVKPKQTSQSTNQTYALCSTIQIFEIEITKLTIHQ